MRLTIDEDSVRAAIRSSVEQQGRLLLQALSLTGVEAITYARSLTSELRPPRRRGEGMRRAHPGHWSDITSNLANAYAWSVRLGGHVIGKSAPRSVGSPISAAGARVPEGSTLTLELSNSMAYAEMLERRDGYWVLSGLSDHVARSVSRLGRTLGWQVSVSA
jgi:hypothetical protein